MVEAVELGAGGRGADSHINRAGIHVGVATMARKVGGNGFRTEGRPASRLMRSSSKRAARAHSYAADCSRIRGKIIKPIRSIPVRRDPKSLVGGFQEYIYHRKIQISSEVSVTPQQYNTHRGGNHAVDFKGDESKTRVESSTQAAARVSRSYALGVPPTSTTEQNGRFKPVSACSASPFGAADNCLRGSFMAASLSPPWDSRTSDLVDSRSFLELELTPLCRLGPPLPMATLASLAATFPTDTRPKFIIMTRRLSRRTLNRGVGGFLAAFQHHRMYNANSCRCERKKG